LRRRSMLSFSGSSSSRKSLTTWPWNRRHDAPPLTICQSIQS
jgi:hypothetical protein